LSEDSGELLQHPRRNLGNRYRSQSQKFVRLANIDTSRFDENLSWAEQNARQAILHDFTDERNWRCLADIKVIIGDGEGLCALLEDVFSVLGRDADNIVQLKGIDFLKIGLELLEAAFARDPLDPDNWWSNLNVDDSLQDNIDSFVLRCQHLDFRDQRANIIFGRRIERLRDAGHTDIFIQLSKHLLAHRPNNHELWMQLGRLHERRGETDEAWMCYDHVQNLRPHLSPRDEYLSRLTDRMDGEIKTSWSQPSVETRETFLQQMLELSQRVSTPISQDEKVVDNVEDETSQHPDLIRLQDLIKNEDFSEAFFLARRLIAQGEDWAEPWLIKAKSGFGE
jgi:tetratricopeptide (TPR) repeat protein